MITDERAWQAVEEKDRSFDGRFFYGVATTGVYCRPSCPSRRPLRKNVSFYQTAADAEAKGLRPCLRCKPLEKAGQDPMVERISRLCEFIREHHDETLTLQTLAKEAGLSPWHLQRSFKAVTGVTPRQYIEACRIETLKNSLREQKSVTTAIYHAGFGSNSRVYERADTRLGMTPAEYRSGGKHVSISHVSVASPLGRMMIGATDRGLCFLQFADSDELLLEMLHREYPAAAIREMPKPWPEEFNRWIRALNEHLSGSRPQLDLPVDLQATAFQMTVWRYLQNIPYGSVESYSEVAEGIGRPKAVRAVARACATNRVAMVIPCHRVIRGTGELGGYKWGIERKRALLDRERGNSNA